MRGGTEKIREAVEFIEAAFKQLELPSITEPDEFALLSVLALQEATGQLFSRKQLANLFGNFIISIDPSRLTQEQQRAVVAGYKGSSASPQAFLKPLDRCIRILEKHGLVKSLSASELKRVQRRYKCDPRGAYYRLRGKGLLTGLCSWICPYDPTNPLLVHVCSQAMRNSDSTFGPMVEGWKKAALGVERSEGHKVESAIEDPAETVPDSPFDKALMKEIGSEFGRIFGSWIEERFPVTDAMPMFLSIVETILRSSFVFDQAAFALDRQIEDFESYRAKLDEVVRKVSGVVETLELKDIKLDAKSVNDLAIQILRSHEATKEKAEELAWIENEVGGVLGVQAVTSDLASMADRMAFKVDYLRSLALLYRSRVSL